MNSHISSDVIDKIRNTCDIIEIISQYIPLKKNGVNYKGLCPFHNEKTPSFIVSPEKQIYHCFGCGAGGNVISFVIQIDNISFPEAVRYLGNKYNIPTYLENVEKNTGYSFLNNSIYNLNKDALKYFKNCLNNAKNARDYIKKRGITKEAVEEFSIGYAPSSWDGLIKYFLEKNNCNYELLIKAGLIKKKDGKSGYYDTFRDRIIFPIIDIQNRVIGFGGRTLSDLKKEIPKYINTPETPVYTKGKNLYGLNNSKNFIRIEKKILIVEGYLDLIAAYQSGTKNIVATLGTALTAEQVQILNRFTEEVIIIFDGDVAGENAAEKGFNNLISFGSLRVKVVELKDGNDPDSFIRNKGKELFTKKIRESKLFIEYMIDKAATKLKEGDTLNTQVKQINKILHLISNISNTVERSNFSSIMSEKLGISDKALLKELDHAALNGKKKITIKERSPTNIKKNLAEYLLIQIMFFEEEKRKEIKKTINPDDFEDSELSILAELLWKQPDIKLSEVIDYLRSTNNKLVGLASRIALENNQFDDIEKTLKDCLKKINNRKINIKMSNIFKERKEIVKNGIVDKKVYNKLQEEYICLKKMMKS